MVVAKIATTTKRLDNQQPRVYYNSVIEKLRFIRPLATSSHDKESDNAMGLFS